MRDLKLIIVDDDVKFRRQIDRLIKWVDIDVNLSGEANNAFEAMKLMNYVNPDIVLTEIRLPEINGIEFISKAKAKWPNCKYIIISIYDSFDYLKKAMRVGAFDYLKKPVGIQEINSAIIRAKEEVYRDIHRQQFIL